MDNFDDLLANSTGALEANPFGDPFSAPRPSSPDPWASYVQTTETHIEGFSASDHSPFATSNAFGGYQAPPEPVQHHDDDITQTDPNTPLELPKDEEIHVPESASGVTSPGFRESISTEPEPAPAHTHDEATSPQVPAGEQQHSYNSPEPSDRSSSTTPTDPTSPAAATVQTEYPVPQLSAPPASAIRHEKVLTPLDLPSSSAFNNSFASLVLGGETIGGGWQDSQAFTTTSTFVNNEPKSPVTADTDYEDSRPLAETAAEILKSQPPKSKPTEAGKEFVITVDDPQKVGDPIRPYIMYTVHTRTSSPLFSKPSFSVLRRYSDFLWLYETLAVNNPGVIVPPVPDKSSLGRFDKEFVQQRRLALEKCIQKIANHPVLNKDADFKLFLESDSFALDIKHRKTELAQERGGFMSTLGQTIAGPKFYEMDEWFDSKKAYLDTLETQLKGLVKAVELVSKHGAELGISVGEFAQSVSELSECDLGKPLSHSLSVLADIQKKAQDLYHSQAVEDVMTFLSTAEEYSRLVNSVRLAFSTRIKCYTLWQNAESEVRRVKSNHEKGRSSGRIPQDRIGHSLSLVADAERRVHDTKADFDRCSRLIKSEMTRFEEERISDFKNALEGFLEGMITRQKELINAWESYQEMLLKKSNANPQRPTSSASQVQVTA